MVQPINFLTKSQVHARFEGKRVAIVGSGPGVLGNAPHFVDGHEIVVRANNYRLSRAAGRRTDVYYSFFGASIKKTSDELKRDGVTLCMCKCPDAQAIESDWHRKNGKMNGVDYRWIYLNRARWWFCDTYVPLLDDFLSSFNLLGRHVPTTGFAAILDVLSFKPQSAYLTGFDFFRSGKHNVTDPWRPMNNDDPIGHVPEQELAWLSENLSRFPITTDPELTRILQMRRGSVQKQRSLNIVAKRIRATSGAAMRASILRRRRFISAKVTD